MNDRLERSDRRRATPHAIGGDAETGRLLELLEEAADFLSVASIAPDHEPAALVLANKIYAALEGADRREAAFAA